MTAASCPKKDFYTPLPPKNVQQTFVLRTQKSVQKSRPKKVGKKVGKKAAKRWQKGGKKGGKKAAKKAVKKDAKRWQKKTAKTFLLTFWYFLVPIISKNFLKNIPENLSCCCLKNRSKSGLVNVEKSPPRAEQKTSAGRI